MLSRRRAAAWGAEGTSTCRPLLRGSWSWLKPRARGRSLPLGPALGCRALLGSHRSPCFHELYMQELNKLKSSFKKITVLLIKVVL